MLMATPFTYDLELGDDAGGWGLVLGWDEADGEDGREADGEESSEERADDKDYSCRWGHKFHNLESIHPRLITMTTLSNQL